MATIGASNPTLADVLSRTDPDGNISLVVELLAQNNDILADAAYTECNNGTKHRTTQRVGIPEPTFRKFNQGVQPSKSETVQVEDTTAMLEDYNEVDKALVDMHDNQSAFRASEAAGVMEGFKQKTARYIFSGDTDTEPEAFMGLGPRFNDLTAPSGRQIVDAQGAGANKTSIWFVCWSPQTCQLIYPKGSVAGFQHHDLGEDTKVFPDGSQMQVLRDHFKWDLGLAVRDWRAVSRVANIDIDTLTKDASGGADLIDLMIDAEANLQNAMMGNGRKAIYVNKTVHTFLRKQAMNAKNVRLSIEEYEGKKIPMFEGIPIRRCDSISNTETQIV